MNDRGMNRATIVWILLLVAAAVGVATMCGSCLPEQTTLLANRSRAPEVPAAQVVTSGTCEKQVIGSYGLLASITVENQTSMIATGQVWVRWEVTGEEPLTRTRSLTLEPGQRAVFAVDEDIDTKRWFRVASTCDYGWSAA